MSVLLKHAYVVTVDRDRRVIPDGWIHVEGDSIAALGPMDELGDRTADEEIDLHGMLAMPGLLNGHMHHWGTLFKNTGEGLLLEPWLDEVALPLLLQPHDTTTCASRPTWTPSRSCTPARPAPLNHIVNVNDHESMKAICEPVLDVGIRQMVTKELRDTPDPPFSNNYPATPHVRGARRGDRPGGGADRHVGRRRRR